MKKAILLLVIFGIGLFLMDFPIKKIEAAPKITIKGVTAWPVNHVNNQYYKEFIKRANEKSKGELEIQFLGGPEVVSVFDQLKAAATGVVDMIHSVPAYYAGIVPEGNITDLVKHGFELKALRESGIIDLYTQAYLEKGKVVFLGYPMSGMAFYIMTKKPVSKLEDVRGLKLRSIGGLSDVFLENWVPLW
jgi:TRAP-type C4-dicarboxylate transport system substrate-binding protein